MFEYILHQLSWQGTTNMINSPPLMNGIIKVTVSGIVGAVVMSILFVLLTYAQMIRQRATLPPGPFPWPIVGNVLQLSKSKPWLQYKTWSRENDNGLLTIWIGRTPTIICNDAWSASELMDKKSSIYSSRPRYVVFGDVTDQSTKNQVLLPYNDHWRLQRKIMHMAVGSQAIDPYKTFQSDESRILMRDLLNDSANFAHHFERYACSLVSILGWGRRVDHQKDYILQFALKMMDDITMMQVPGLYWMETIPELQYLPAWIYALPSELRRFGKVLRKFWWALDSEAARSDTHNFSKTLIEMKEKEGLSEEDIGEMTANLIGGGLDTTSSTLHTLVLGLCLFPQALKAAHAEIDRVIGAERSPDWDDLDKLPYCHAVMKEAMRWRSVTALGGFAHSPIKDDIYRGYHLPAGTHIFGNLWAIHSNPKDFPDPDSFKPERYLEENQLPYPNKTGHNAFGWGRRACSGRYFAEQGLSMTIARLVWAYDILPGLDENGEPVELDSWAYTDNENTQPLPFKARFIPRSQEIKNFIEEEAASARKRLTAWDGKSTVTLEQFI